MDKDMQRVRLQEEEPMPLRDGDVYIVQSRGDECPEIVRCTALRDGLVDLSNIYGSTEVDAVLKWCYFDKELYPGFDWPDIGEDA